MKKDSFSPLVPLTGIGAAVLALVAMAAVFTLLYGAVKQASIPPAGLMRWITVRIRSRRLSCGAVWR